MQCKVSLGKKGHKIEIDMDRVYRLIDSGKTVNQVADEFGVSAMTIYRRHWEYQESKMKKSEGLPRLPDE